jgi:hypothetical protein
MSAIVTKLENIETNIAKAYVSLNKKGATMPAENEQKSNNLAATIDSIDTGNATVSYIPSTHTLVITV